MSLTRNRPVFLNLFQIHQPVTAIVSILHRLSGLLLAFSLPGLVYLLQLSLSGPDGFSQVEDLVSSQGVRVIVVILCWILALHFFAGIRFLLIDIDLGITKKSARKMAWAVHVGAVLTTFIAAGFLL
jgi:succinate dehydrogenase / fumarate reductase, cytochrome b subunit